MKYRTAQYKLTPVESEKNFKIPANSKIREVAIFTSVDEPDRWFLIIDTPKAGAITIQLKKELYEKEDAS